jgi:Putative transposase/Transposase zinc-binding domain
VPTPSRTCAPFAPAGDYVPRRPHDTVLYGIIRDHLATFLAHTERAYAAPLPKYVVDTFEGYLSCGDVAAGFLRCHCEGCGHDVLVAFSCKHRGLCPSCGTRRMSGEAVQVVDRVLPNVPLRQWVVSLPWELRRLAAMKPGVLGAMDRIFAEEIARLTRRLAGVNGAQTGSVACPQMFGGSLNVHPHMHTLAADGVFEKTDQGAAFHEAPPPSKDDVAEVAQRVRDRAVRWLHRHGYLDERAAEERGNEAAEPSAIDGCTQLALAGGAFLARPAASPNDTTDADLDRRARRFSATCDGFDVHCAVRLAADDVEGRERLVRYCTRPPFALDRIEVLRDGRIAYRLKVPRRGRTHRVMTPMEFMARLAALVPPPKIPFVRYHGVFASRSSWRPLVTPKPPPEAAKPKPCAAPSASAPTTAAAPPVPAAASAAPAPAPAPAAVPAPALPTTASPAAATRATATPEPSLSATAAGLADAEVAPGPGEPVVFIDPTMITVARWGQLGDGELFARARYVDWALLMRRTWGFDVLRCPRCSRKMRVLATILDPAVVRKILEHLGVRASPLPRAPPRDPDPEQGDFGFEAA